MVTAAAVAAPGVYFLTETEHLGCFEAGSTGVGFRVAIAVPLTVALRATQTVAVTLTVAVTEAVTLSVATKDRLSFSCSSERLVSILFLAHFLCLLAAHLNKKTKMIADLRNSE